MDSKTFQEIARKYSQTVKLAETAPPEVWAAKLQEELAALQLKLHETNPQNLLYFALEKQCFELEEAVEFLKQDAPTTAPPQPSEEIRRVQAELAAKQSELQDTSPQNFLRFALQKQCLELEAKLQVLKQEGRQRGQARLLENLRQAIHYGDKEVYDSLIKGETEPLLPMKEEAAYESWLEIKKLAANKKWPGQAAAPPPSNPIIAKRPPTSPPPPPPPAQPPPPPARSVVSPPAEIASLPVTPQAATLTPEVAAEIPAPAPVGTDQAAPKRPRANPWVWVLPAVIVAVIAMEIFSRHSDQPPQLAANPTPVPSENSQAPSPALAAGAVTLDGLILLFDDASQTTNTADRVKTFRAFLQQSADFAVEHPEQTNLWVKRALSAMELDYEDAGWTAGKQLTALGLVHSEDPALRKVMADLQSKGWLAPKRPTRDWKTMTEDQAIAAASEGDEEAQVMLGNCYYGGNLGFSQDFAEADQWYRKAAVQGDSAGQEALGALYEYGRGVPQDYAEAFKWFRKAAAQGVSEAQRSLAILYLNGSGVDQNYPEALTWFRKSADQGNSLAQIYLGLMCENGWGLKTNVAEAMSWYQKAIALGNTNAAAYLKRLAQAGQRGAH
jgi:hypothetical protein